MHDPFAGVSEDWLDLLKQWLELAKQTEPNDPNAAALATATSAGVPSVRMVLVKGIDERGLRFYTNAESEKGHQLAENPVAALCFHWKSQRRQVRVEGEVSTLTQDETAAYFHTRSRGSQIAAAVSAQSRPLGSRQQLDNEARTYAATLHGAEVPLPAHWTGYLLAPRVVEFWIDGADRLHNRLQLYRTESGWQTQRLYP